MACVVTFLASVFLVGCGKSTSGGSGYGSCNSPSHGECYDFTGSNFAAPGASSSACAADSSFTFSATDTCANANRTGSCTIYANTANTYVIRFYSPTFSASDAQSACTSLGGTGFQAN